MYRYKLDIYGEYKARNKDNYIGGRMLREYKMKSNEEWSLRERKEDRWGIKHL